MILNNDSKELKIKVTKEKEGKRIKEFLKEEYAFSSRLLSRIKKRNGLLLNGQEVSVTKTIFRDDILTVLFNDERLNYEPEKMSLDILYEDGDVLILNKPPYLVVHPTKSHESGTLANGIAHYFRQKCIQKKIRFINRLDMDTSGIIIIAKNSYAHQYVQKQMEDNTIEKGYLAVIENVFPYDSGEIRLPIGKKNKGDIARQVYEGGKPSQTLFKKKEDFSKFGALLYIRIITGRTHQIRVHFSHYNNPLIGDHLYGSNHPVINRHALHSYYLKLKVPRKSEPVEVRSTLPEDMVQLIEELRSKSHESV